MAQFEFRSLVVMVISERVSVIDNSQMALSGETDRRDQETRYDF